MGKTVESFRIALEEEISRWGERIQRRKVWLPKRKRRLKLH